MTTLELIERGIGHNCLSDAYDLGRADAIREREEFWEMQNNFAYEQGRADKYQEIVSEYMLLTEKQVAEIRADAIAEISREMRMLYGNEYEKKIKADAIDECIKLIGGNIKSIVGIYNKDTPLTDRASYRVAKNELIEELVKQLEQLKEKK